MTSAAMQGPPACRNCAGCGWVCENHADRPWQGMSAVIGACDCGAGMPCGACNLRMASDGYVFSRERAIVTWLQEMKPIHSAWSAALAWVADQIRNGKHWAEVQAIEARNPSADPMPKEEGMAHSATIYGSDRGDGDMK